MIRRLARESRPKLIMIDMEMVMMGTTPDMIPTRK
jgi:hypothetical protein